MQNNANLALSQTNRGENIGRVGSYQVRHSREQIDVASWSRRLKSSVFMIYIGFFWPLAIVVLRRCAHAVFISFPPCACCVLCVMWQYCVGSASDGSPCKNFYNVTRPKPTKWGGRRVTAAMVPCFPGLVGAALCNSCFSHASRQTQDTETAAEEGNVPYSAGACVSMYGKL